MLTKQNVYSKNQMKCVHKDEYNKNTIKHIMQYN